MGKTRGVPKKVWKELDLVLDNSIGKGVQREVALRYCKEIYQKYGGLDLLLTLAKKIIEREEEYSGLRKRTRPIERGSDRGGPDDGSVEDDILPHSD